MSNEHEWLDLIDISGPFLASPVLKKAFPQGLDQLDPSKRKNVRQAYDEWREALEEGDPNHSKFHKAWIDLVLKQILELNDDGIGDVLKQASQLPEKLSSHVPEHGVTLQPDYAVVDDQHADAPLMLINIYDPDVDLKEAVKGDGWSGSPADRMVRLCRDANTRLGLVTNGELWMFVDAPVGAITSFATWYARLWSQERETLQAFISLFGIRRFFVDQSEQLPSLLDQSLQYQDEVTDALGGQVRRAVEVLIQALDKANIDDDGQLLADVDPRELYEAGLTVMMRLVFLLSAEERDLLLLGDERYETNYAVSTLRVQLRIESDEILDRRWDAWSRLLAIFRAVYGGIEHETLRMPALGGSLFDPDRFPFLEGREKDSNWQEVPARPLPISNHTVLLLLDAIQLFQGRALSYRGLDIEQLGYVYEGLLDHTVKRAKEVTLELDAVEGAKQPWLALGELESTKLDGINAVEALLKERTGSSATRVTNDMKKAVNEEQSERLLTACHNDICLRDRLKPFFHLIRLDSWDYPLVYPEMSFMVTTGEDRRQSGSHYTPTSLTEAVVRETLEPIAYVGPAAGKPRQEWQLKSPAELLDLKICDPAMGSGAFLVQVCRWLGERLVEAWSLAERAGKLVTAEGEVVEDAKDQQLLSTESDERAVTATRLIAERCIYGVDINPLAVELAKLSIWLMTLAKGRPFGFLDHNLRCGDSLLGIHQLDQLTEFSLTPTGKGQQRLFGENIKRAVQEAIELRQRLREMPILDIHDVEAMARLDSDARQKLEMLERIADVLIAENFAARGKATSIENRLTSLATQAGQAVEGDQEAIKAIVSHAKTALLIDLPSGKPGRRPFHWPLEFPEVFAHISDGFDAVIGNPPFIRGKDIKAAVGTLYRNYLKKDLVGGLAGSADFAIYFLNQASRLVSSRRVVGLVMPKNVSEGDSKDLGLRRLLGKGFDIFSADKNISWPGKALVIVSRVHLFNGKFLGDKQLGERTVEYISEYLTDKVEWNPVKLADLPANAYQGVITHGDGFELTAEVRDRHRQTDRNLDVVWPYLNGDDVSNQIGQRASRGAITFWDWPRNRSADGSWLSMDERKKKEALLVGEVPYDYPGKVAADYPMLLDVLDKKVRPHRTGTKENGTYKLRAPLPQRWWQYADKRPGLYHDIGFGEMFCRHPKGWVASARPLSKVIVRVQTTKHHAFALVDSNQVINNTINVFASESLALFAILSSEVHGSWFYRYGSNLGVAGKKSVGYPRYFHTAVYATFPFVNIDELSELGNSLLAKRDQITAKRQIGLTSFYNMVHSPTYNDDDISDFRDLMNMLECKILDQYLWSDLYQPLGFYENPYLPVADNIRFTFDEVTRRELLLRLEMLNKKKFQDMVPATANSDVARIRTSSHEHVGGNQRSLF